MRLHVNFGESQSVIRVGFSEAHVIRDSDYEKLRNLPSINGVTIIGEKTLEDYGLEIDKTLSEEGAVADAKAAGDAIRGKYTKPEDGIPKDDLSADVKYALVKTFRFVFDDNYDIVSAPTIQEVRSAAPNALARLLFADDSYEEFIPLTDNNGVFSHVVDNTIVTLYYDSGSWFFAYEEVPSVDETLSAAGLAADAKATGDAIAGKYTKPENGIPASDLEDDVLVAPDGGSVSQFLAIANVGAGGVKTFGWENIYDLAWTEFSVDANETVYYGSSPAGNRSFDSSFAIQIQYRNKLPAVKLTLSTGAILNLPLVDYELHSGYVFAAVYGETVYSVTHSYNARSSKWTTVYRATRLTDYANQANKPSIDGVTLEGDRSFSELGIQPGDFVVTVTYDGVNDYYSANKTFEQIKTAKQAGKNIVLTYGDPCEYYRLAKWVEDDPLEYAVFSFNQGTSVNQIMMDNTGAVSRTVASAGTYSKPNGGIPASDLADDVLLLPAYNGSVGYNNFLRVTRNGNISTYSWEQVNDFEWIELSVDANDNIVSSKTAALVVVAIQAIVEVRERHPAIHLTLNNGFVVSLPMTSYKNGSSNIVFNAVSGYTSYVVTLVKKPDRPYYFSYSHTDLTPAGIGAIAAPNSPSSNQALWFDGALWGSKTILPSDVGAIPEPNDLLEDSFLYRHSNGGWVCLASGDAYDAITNGKSATFIDASVSGSTMTIYEEPGVIFDLLVGARKTYIATEDEEPRFFYPVKFNDTTGCISVECIVGRTLYSCDLYPSNAPDYDQMSGVIVSTTVPTAASDLGAYVKPGAGIPKSDLDSDAQDLLGAVFEFSVDANNNVISGPTWQAVLGAPPKSVARVSFVADSDVIYLPLTGGNCRFMVLANESYCTLEPSASTDHWTISWSDIVSDISGKLDVNQGVANAGKFIVVGNDGIAVPVAMQAWQGGTYSGS